MEQKNFFKKNSSLSGLILTTEQLSVNAEPSTDFEKFSHHEEFEIYWFIEGDLFFSYEGTLIDIAPGDIVIIAPRLIHRTIIKKKCRYYRKHIKFSVDFFIDKFELYHRLITRQILRFNKSEVQKLKLDQLLLEIENTICQKTTYGEFCGLTSLSYFLMVVENHCEQYKNQVLPLKNEKVTQIVEYIDKHLSSNLDYKTLAAHFCTSEKSIYKLFKEGTGFSLAKYITERRIIKAKHILNQGGSAYEAFVATGYKDYSVFYRNFLKETGITPTLFIVKNKYNKS